MSSRASLTSLGEVSPLALVGHPSSDGITIKMPFPIGLVKTESGFIVRSVDTGLER